MVSHVVFCDISFNISTVLAFGLFALRFICCHCPALIYLAGGRSMPSDILTLGGEWGECMAGGRGKLVVRWPLSLHWATLLTVATPLQGLSHVLHRPQLLTGDPGSWIPETKCLLFVLSADQWEQLPIVANL